MVARQAITADYAPGTLETVDNPLNAFGEPELCPGPEALARYNAAHR